MIPTLIVTCTLAGLYLCWLSARTDDRKGVWGNRWGDPDHRVIYHTGRRTRGER